MHLIREYNSDFGTIVAYPDKTAFLGDYFRIVGLTSKWVTSGLPPLGAI